MKSKEILPEDERQDCKAELMVRMPGFGPDLWNALLAAENELQEDKEAFLKTLITREDEIHKHISHIQDLEKEIKEYKKLAKDNVPELVKMLKNRKG